MVRSHPVLTALALTLLLPATAAAGPIEWEVSAQLARVGGAYGPSASYYLTDEFIGGGATIHEQTFSRLASAGPSHGWGWRSVVVGSVVPDGPRLDPLHWAEQTFDIKLALTDLASGQSGTLVFSAWGGETLVQDYDNPFSGILLGRRSQAAITGTAEQTVTLGGIEYHVGLRVQTHGDNADLVADVQAGAVQATPEPGTLALAGLGLAGLGLRVRRSARRGDPTADQYR